MNANDLYWLLPACLACGLVGGALGDWLSSRRAVDADNKSKSTSVTPSPEVVLLRAELHLLTRKFQALARDVSGRPAGEPVEPPSIEPSEHEERHAPAAVPAPAPVAGFKPIPSPMPVAGSVPAEAKTIATPTIDAPPRTASAEEAAAAALLEMSDEEIDALPPDLPVPGKPRKRVMAPPRKPTLNRL